MALYIRFHDHAAASIAAMPHSLEQECAPATCASRGAAAAAWPECGRRSKEMRALLSSKRQARTLPLRTRDRNSLYSSCRQAGRVCAWAEVGIHSRESQGAMPDSGIQAGPACSAASQAGSGPPSHPPLGGR